ncbi:MAG TPA: CopD family protein [Nitrosopumilaceae archaeon]|nr:CopD family protein [Nitrosopumilaceae archaeon]
MKKVLLVVIIACCFIFGLAEAHPFIEDSEPKQSSNVPPGITQIIIYYSEAVEMDYSTIKVLDNKGTQVDNKDTKYFQGENSLVVTTRPLDDGVYTVTSKVLSKVDGHIVDDALIFSVGSAKIDPSLLNKKSEQPSVYIPEALARFPGLVGQVMILGAVISSLLIWRSLRTKQAIKENLELQKKHSHLFLKLTGVGMLLVLGSNIAMLAVQSIALQTSALEAIQTGFGTTWLVRMSLTIILFAIWFWAERKAMVGKVQQFLILGFSLALIATTTMLGHGAATMHESAIILDYTHNLLASVWIGGVIYAAFAMIPSFEKMESDKRERLSLLMIPKLSSMIIVAVGILLITGPTLLWFLESDVGLLYDSTYGKLILAKIALGIILIVIGGYNQFRIQKPAEKNLQSGTISVYKKFRKSLKVESIIGIVLLGVVALLANSSLPAGEIQQVQALDVNGYQTIQFSSGARFDVSIEPLSSGTNTVSVSVMSLDGKSLGDVSEVVMKVSNPQKGISPIESNMSPIKSADSDSQVTQYVGNATFGFTGTWHVEIVALRTQTANDAISFDVLIKPRLSELKTSMVEYGFPDADVAPLYPVFDGTNTIWISDTAKPRIWKFTIDDKQFKSYEFDGQISVTLNIDNDGKIWYTDTPNSRIGFFDPDTEKFENIDLPIKSVPIFTETDLQNNIWVALADKNILLKYNQEKKEFSEFKISQAPLSGPTALILDETGNIWFTEAQAGKIGVINPQTGQTREFTPEESLKEPTALFFDDNGNLWISEHTGPTITRFDPILETFERVPVLDPDALPFGMTSDKYGNIWIGQHTVDSLGVYDPYNGNFNEIPIPTQQSFVQFITSDDDGNIWIVEQRGQKLGMVSITEMPRQIAPSTGGEFQIKYVELVSPLISAGIIATSLFFVQSIKDKRRINSLVD